MDSLKDGLRYLEPWLEASAKSSLVEMHSSSSRSRYLLSRLGPFISISRTEIHSCLEGFQKEISLTMEAGLEFDLFKSGNMAFSKQCLEGSK